MLCVPAAACGGLWEADFSPPTYEHGADLDGQAGWTAGAGADGFPAFVPRAGALDYAAGYVAHGGGTGYLEARGGGEGRAWIELPAKFGPREPLYFSFLTEAVEPPTFAWVAFGGGPEDGPSLGVVRTGAGNPVMRARARGESGAQTEGEEAVAQAGVNLVVGRVVLGGGAGGADRIDVLLNPADYREPAAWDSGAELSTGLPEVSTLWIRKGSGDGVSAFGRLRVGRAFGDVVAAVPVEVRDVFARASYVRALGAPRALGVVREEGAEAVEFSWHRPPGLAVALQESADLLEWREVPDSAAEVLRSDPDPRGLGEWQRVRRGLGDGGGALFFRVLAEAEAPADESVEVTLEPSEVHQIIDGFGASVAYSAQNMTDAMADLFFHPENGLGLSLCRIRVNFRGGNTNSWEWRTARLAQARGARVWASPWSPPAELKEGATGAHGHRGGRLRDDAYADYAALFADFVDWITHPDRGIDLYALSPQNEPDYRVGSNESCDWRPAELLEFLAAHLRPTLDARGYADLPIVAPETMEWDRGGGWNAFLSSPDVDIVAFHNYDWSWDRFRLNSANPRVPGPVNTEKRIWQTEISDDFSGNDYTDTIEDALVWADHIHRVIVDAGAAAWHWWWIAPPGDDTGINNQTLVDSRTGLIEHGEPVGEGLPHVLKRGYAIGQFARFVRPGFRRVGVDAVPAPGLKLSAFKGGGRLVVVAIHSGDSTLPLRIGGLPAGVERVAAWMTTAQDDLSPQGHLPGIGTMLDAVLPPRSIVTFVFD
ncbi:MAG: hypothetical protein JJU00_09705 [Opitutales bacterium]|nr:hypothetical protein [Opitutales bacterium]